MTVDLLVNIALVLFISSNLAILYMSNIGYVFAHVAAMTGFLLLRKERPDWPRPSKVASIWPPSAGVSAAANAGFLVVGAGGPTLNGCGTWTDFGTGVGILVGSVLLYLYRRVVQDKQPVHLREATPKLPPDVVAPAAVGQPMA